MSLSGKTIFISGASRGIGLAIALRAARDGANVALIAKTAEPHPKLEGTVYTAAEQIEAAGGQALPIVGDIRDEQQVDDAVAQAVERFGGIDVCVNNASAINLARTEAARHEALRPDAGHQRARDVRGVSRACIPHLRGRENPHVLTLSPPLDLDPRWLGPHIGYTLAKYGMSLDRARPRRRAARGRDRLQRAVAAHARRDGGGAEPARRRRGDGARAPARGLRRRRVRDPQPPRRECTGNAFLCEDVLVEEGVTDLSAYATCPARSWPSTCSSTRRTRPASPPERESEPA